MDNDASSHSRKQKDQTSAAGGASCRLCDISGLAREEEPQAQEGLLGADEKNQVLPSLALVVKDLNCSFEEIDQETGANLLTIDKKRSRTLTSVRINEHNSLEGGRLPVVVHEDEMSERPRKNEQNTNRQSRWGDESPEPPLLKAKAEDKDSKSRSSNSSRSCQKSKKPDYRAIQNQRREKMEEKNRDKKKADQAPKGSFQS